MNYYIIKERAIANLMSSATEARDIQLGFEELAAGREEIVRQTGAALEQDNIRINTITIIASIVVIALAVVIAFYTAMVISSPVKRVSERVQRIADGDLTGDALKVLSKDEVGQLTVATNALSEKLHSMLRQIQTVSHSEELLQSAVEVREGTTQVALTMNEIAEGTEAQASNLASHMDDFVASARAAD